MLTTEFKRAVVEFVKPYYADNDPGHQIDHASNVAMLGLRVNRRCKLGLPECDIFVAGMCHDMFTSNRKMHHILVHDWAMETDVPFMDVVDRDAVARAMLEHRASYKGEYSSKLSEVIAAADRGVPDLDQLFARSYSYSHSTISNPQHSECVDMANYHMHEKYGRNGYVKYPEMYQRMFSKELEILHAKIDTLPQGRKIVRPIAA